MDIACEVNKKQCLLESKKHVNFSERKENIITKVPLLPWQFILEGKTIKEHSGPSINL